MEHTGGLCDERRGTRRGSGLVRSSSVIFWLLFLTFVVTSQVGEHHTGEIVG